MLASVACIGVGVFLMAWWSGLALLVAFVFAGLAQVTDRPTAGFSARSRLQAEDDRLGRCELDSAA